MYLPGGIIYVIMLYLVIFRFVEKKVVYKKSDMYFFERAINYSCIVTLLIANFKGEVMRSGLVLLAIVIIKFIFIINSKDGEITTGNNDI